MNQKFVIKYPLVIVAIGNQKQLVLAFFTALIMCVNMIVSQSAIPLNGRWQFRYDKEDRGLTEKWYQSQSFWWQKSKVPGFWRNQTYDGYSWYRIQFVVSDSTKKGNLALIFNSVDDNAEVWLNGNYIGAHVGYGVKFWFDITRIINWEGSNTLTVRIEDSGGPGGINGEVYMDWYGDKQELLKTEYTGKLAVQAPEWVREMIIYEIFVRDFSPAGNFQGIIAKLDELKELSVDCIWLMPIHPVGKVNRKGEWGSPYSCVDYYTITSDFGTPEDFRRLVAETHQRGMRLILDMVLNHSAWDSPLLELHPDWYTQDRRRKIIPPNSDWTDVADFNYDNQDLHAYMIDMLKHWVTEYEVDGFRFDVAEMVPYEFWDKARDTLTAIKPDILFLAEGDHPKLHIRDFDLTYSWNVWHNVIEVCRGEKPVSTLSQTLENERYRYPRNSLQLRFIENHDKKRAAFEIPGKALKLAHAFIYTIPGVPLLYNGQEVGLDYRLELFDKDSIKWENGDEDLRRFIISLGQLKESNPDFSSFDWKIIDQDLPEDVIGWTRGVSTVCYANFSAIQKKFSVEETKSQSEMKFSISEAEGMKTEFGKTDIILQPWDLIVLEKVE